jgi:hyaluronan synthase
MAAFFLQLWTVLQEQYIQSYLLFFISANAFWWLRVYLARKNKDYTADFTGSYAVIIPVFREPADVFERVLKTIKAGGSPATGKRRGTALQWQTPTQIIVTIDDSEHADKHVKRLARKYADIVLPMPERVGKREQFYLAAQHLTDVDVVVTVDSDTYWDASTLNILRPFSDPTVGAASGNQTIFDYKANYVRRAAEWLEDMRFRVTLGFQSYFGQVNVIPGRTLAMRAHLFKEIVVDTRDERVLGRRIITSDDASLTMGVLQRGFKSVYQSNSLVHTDAPNSYLRFWRQYLRWYRGSIRRLVYKFPVLIRQHPLVFLANVEFNIGTFVYAAILGSFAFKLHYRLYEVVPVSGFAVTESFNPWFLLLLLAGFFVSAYIRNLPHLLHRRDDVLFLPIFACFTFVTMLPLKIAALFSFFENGWMTRKQHTSSIREERVGLTRTVAVVTGLIVLAVTIPLPYLVDIKQSDVPLATIHSRDMPPPKIYHCLPAMCSVPPTAPRAACSTLLRRCAVMSPSPPLPAVWQIPTAIWPTSHKLPVYRRWANAASGCRPATLLPDWSGSRSVLLIRRISSAPPKSLSPKPPMYTRPRNTPLSILARS